MYLYVKGVFRKPHAACRTVYVIQGECAGYAGVQTERNFTANVLAGIVKTALCFGKGQRNIGKPAVIWLKGKVFPVYFGSAGMAFQKEWFRGSSEAARHQFFNGVRARFKRRVRRLIVAASSSLS